MAKQSFPPFLEVTDYNPINNKSPASDKNYIYYKYTNSITRSDTEFTHYINSNIDTNYSIRILYVGGGGYGGSSNSKSGGGGGGSGGQVLLSEFSYNDILNNIIKFKIGKTGASTSIYNFTNGITYTANAGNNASNSTKKRGTNGANGIAIGNNTYTTTTTKDTIIIDPVTKIKITKTVTVTTTNPYPSTTGYGGGAGGGGGGYSGGDNASDGDMPSGFINNENCGYDKSTYRCPWYIKINNFVDGTGEVRTSYGGWGHAGNEAGSNGDDGYILIFYRLKSKPSIDSNSNTLASGKVYYGYNPLGNYLSQNYDKTDKEWCYIYLTSNSVLSFINGASSVVVSTDDILKINNLIGSNTYNIIAVGGGGGGGGGSSTVYKGLDKNKVLKDWLGVGGGGGAGGDCNDIINTTKKISTITIGGQGSDGDSGNDNGFNGRLGKTGDSTTITFSDSSLECLGGNSGGGALINKYGIKTDSLPNNDQDAQNSGSGDKTYKYLRTFGSKGQGNFSPSGGAARGLDFDDGGGEHDQYIRDYYGQNTEDIQKISNPSFNIYSTYKGDMSSDDYDKVLKCRVKKNDSGTITMTEINSNNGGSAYQSGNKVEYNFKGTDSTVNTAVIISKGGDGGDYKGANGKNNGPAGDRGSPGFVLIWFKKPFPL